MSECDSAACLAALGAGEWRANGTWRWHARACCGFGHVGAARARELLRGRRLLFVGDSTARRHMWAVIDAVGGRRRVRRRRGGAVPDSRAAFDEAAIRLNDTIFDSQRAYHGGQVVLLNVDDGAGVAALLLKRGTPVDALTRAGMSARALCEKHRGVHECAQAVAALLEEWETSKTLAVTRL